MKLQFSLAIVAAQLLPLGLLLGSASPRQANAQDAGSVQATRTILVGTVSVYTGGSTLAHAGVSGETLQAGDRIVTGTPGGALITIFDDSEVELDPATDVSIEALTVSADGGVLVALFQAAGLTVSTALLGDGSTYELRTPHTVAVVRGFLHIVQLPYQPMRLQQADPAAPAFATTFRSRVVRDAQSGLLTGEDHSFDSGALLVHVQDDELTVLPGERLRAVPDPRGGRRTPIAEPGGIQSSRESGESGGTLTRFLEIRGEVVSADGAVVEVRTEGGSLQRVLLPDGVQVALGDVIDVEGDLDDRGVRIAEDVGVTSRGDVTVSGIVVEADGSLVERIKIRRRPDGASAESGDDAGESGDDEADGDNEADGHEADGGDEEAD